MNDTNIIDPQYAREVWEGRDSGQYSDAEIAEASRILTAAGWE